MRTPLTEITVKQRRVLDSGGATTGIHSSGWSKRRAKKCPAIIKIGPVLSGPTGGHITDQMSKTGSGGRNKSGFHDRSARAGWGFFFFLPLKPYTELNTTAFWNKGLSVYSSRACHHIKLFSSVFRRGGKKSWAIAFKYVSNTTVTTKSLLIIKMINTLKGASTVPAVIPSNLIKNTNFFF